MSRQWPPSRILSAGIVIGLALLLTAVYLATSAPYLGIGTEPGNEGARITRVDKSSPLVGMIEPGDEIIAISQGNYELQLEPFDAVLEPDDSSNFGPYNLFFERQGVIWSILSHGRFSLAVQRNADERLNGYEPEWITVSVPRNTRPRDLPASFWYQTMCGLAILWMGVAAWAFARNERGPFFYTVAGLGIAIAIIASAIYTTRSLALPSDLFLSLSRANQFGAMLFAGAGTTLLWYYPTRISDFRFERLMYALVALILAANWGQWLDSLDLLARMTLLAWAVTDIVLAVIQWRRTRFEPVERARLKWFVYAWFSGVIGYLGLVVAPQLVSKPSLIHQQYAWGLFVLTYLGIALGIVRYRLFDLDRWILMAWFWFACGILILLLDGILLVWLNLQHALSLVISVIVVGWIYFPLRQVLLSRLLPSSRREDLWEQLSRMISHAFDAHHSVEQQWKSAMQRSFNPLHTRRKSLSCEDPCLLDDGLRLRVPLIGEESSLELSYANHGHRLFDREDVQFTRQAMTLFSYVQQYRESFRQGIRTERERVARDLHDDVGARLLSIIYRTEDSELAILARECLHELRDVIQGLQKQTVSLDQSFSRWHKEARERCELFGVELDMSLSPQASTMIFTPRTDRNLTSIVREFLSNTLRHAKASRITISLDKCAGYLVLDTSDDGIGWRPDMTNSHMGIGLYSIRERCEELGGQMALYSPINGGAGIRCLIPEQGEAQP